MSNFDWAQINACKIASVDWKRVNNERSSFILLCWWHVLHAWQQHFHIPQSPELWELLKRRICMENWEDFNAAWDQIKWTAPDTFVQYLEETWMKDEVVAMWWHHVLKWKFLLGKRNHCIDHLVHTLVERVVPYYALKQKHQDLNFKGPDIEMKKRMDIHKRAGKYTEDQIQHVEDSRYLVVSQSQPSRKYNVDIEVYSCNCLDFPLISFCKHMAAVQHIFEQVFNEPRPLVSLPTSPPSPMLPMSDPTEHTPTLLSALPPSQRSALTELVILMDTASSWLRKAGRKELTSVANLQVALEALLLETDNSGVLPSSTHVPRLSDWKAMQEAMMPNRKTGSKPRKSAIDRSYGTGASSGSKAKSGDVAAKDKRRKLRYVLTVTSVSN
ncbi:hypothetical protein DFH08DRAFT_966340 [Mycena albidolilacea]|uniref:SWIM-type domain-containing protein n=1 Tax=Mycena albidolilacea TaxID=1033008 RepID=A0AAD6ZNI4_9AGAR|nr:hypothetical protein DFH08DRAFT_966340 [Mycena albidolilacea]